MEFPHMIVWGISNVHAEAPSGDLALDFLAIMSAKGLSQLVQTPAHVAVHMLDHIFTAVQREGNPVVEEIRVDLCGTQLS